MLRKKSLRNPSRSAQANRKHPLWLEEGSQLFASSYPVAWNPTNNEPCSEGATESLASRSPSVSSSDREPFHEALRRSSASSVEFRGRSSYRRILPPTPVVLVVSSAQACSPVDEHIESEDESQISRTCRFSDDMSSDLLDSSSPSSNADVPTITSLVSPTRKSRQLPSLPPSTSKAIRKLSMQLQKNGDQSGETGEPYSLAHSTGTRHQSMTDFIPHPSAKSSERNKLEVPLGSLETIFRRCSIFSKTEDESPTWNESRSSESISFTPHQSNASPEQLKVPTPRASPSHASAKPISNNSNEDGSSAAKQGSLYSGGPERKPSIFGGLGLLHFSVQYFPVRKRLRLIVSKAERLAGSLKPDLELNTFLKVFLSPGKSQKQKSHRLVKRTHETIYNEEFFFVNIDANDVMTKSIEIRICHRTTKQLHADLVVGEVKVPLSSIRELGSKQEIQVVRSLMPKEFKKLGRIYFGACLETAAHRLTININKIDELPRCEISGPPDPFVRLTLDQNGVIQTKQTRMLKSTSNPVFREAVMFLISSKAEDLQNMSLLLTVVDGATHRSTNEVIGQVLLSNVGAEKSCLDQWHNMLQHPGKEIKACQILRSPERLGAP